MKIHTLGTVLALCLMGSIEVFASGKITNVNPSAGQIELTIETTPGDSYQMQCRPSLASGDWIDLASFVAEGSATIKTVDGSAANCYFRVVKVAEQPIIPGGDPFPPPPPPPPPSPPGG